MQFGPREGFKPPVPPKDQVHGDHTIVQSSFPLAFQNVKAATVGVLGTLRKKAVPQQTCVPS